MLMNEINKRAIIHATESSRCDAPCAGPATRANSNQSGKINFRKHLYIGSWNVRTLLDVNRQAMTMLALHEYDIDIACLSEVRIPECGSRQIQVPGTNVFY